MFTRLIEPSPCSHRNARVRYTSTQTKNQITEFIMPYRAKTALFFLIALRLTGAALPETKPEEVGLSKERLLRIHETIQSHIDSHDISGAVTLVMRNGRIAHLEAHGAM